MSRKEIIRVPIFPFKMVNAYLVKSERGCIVVDTGLLGSERKIERLLARNGLNFGDVKLIVVTHARVDCAGSAAHLRELTGAAIFAHQDDANFCCRKRPITYCPTGLVGKLFFKTPLPHEPYEGFVPDIMMKSDDTFDLKDFGLDGLVRRTGGHTPGSAGILVGGIAFTGRAMRLVEDAPHTVARELRRMVEGRAQHFYMGHRGPLGATRVMRHAQSLLAIVPRTCASPRCDHQSH
jgi:hydroxyacylglutathione hydrolase